jgi:arsenate reductase
MNLKPRDLLRKSESVYKELGLAADKFSDSELIGLMIEHPDLFFAELF